jgi:hypothetical protein
MGFNQGLGFKIGSRHFYANFLGLIGSGYNATIVIAQDHNGSSLQMRQK